MSTIFGTLIVLVGRVAQIETARRHQCLHHLIESRVVFPVGRSYPNVGSISNFLKQLLHILRALLLDIGDKQFVTPKHTIT